MAQTVIVRQVWARNLEEELYLIKCTIASGFRSAAIDTEFPGTIFDPLPQHVYSRLSPQEYYLIMKKNVDKLEIIQLGFTLFDDFGNHCVWQFNFRNFDKRIHPHSKASISFLEKQGIDFFQNRKHGINSGAFARGFKSMVLPYILTWITFQGSYDFGLLIKIMTERDLPYHVEDFMMLVGGCFGLGTFDLKLITSLLGIHGGLEKVGKSLGLARVTGKCHQAGSDSLFTVLVFMELRKRSSWVNEFTGLNHKLYGLITIGE